MLIGYARVSTADQTTALQRDALDAAGCGKVFLDEGVSGSVPPTERPAFRQLLDHAREGDEIVAWRLDRVGRNARAVLALVEDELAPRGITLRTLNDGISTAGTTGRLVLTILLAVAEMEKEVLRERTAAGVQAARERGATLGRPRVLNPEQVRLARELRAGGRSIRQIAAVLGVGKSTINRALEGT